MSWFSDLADKAENLLNKIDQNAAAVLQEKDKKNKPIDNSYISSNNDIQINDKDDFNKTNVLTNIDSNSQSKDIKEDNFLSKKKKHLKVANKKVSSPIKKDKDVSENYHSIDASHLHLNNTNSEINFFNPETNEFLTNSLSSPNISYDVPHPQSTVDINSDYITFTASQNTDDVSGINNFEQINIENAMLKNEISVANIESSMLLSKIRNAEKAVEDAHSRLSELERLYNQVIKENENLHQRNLLYEKQLNEKKIENVYENKYDEKSENSENRVLQEKIENLEFNLTSMTTFKNDLDIELRSTMNNCIEMEEKLNVAKAETARTVEEWKNYKVRVNNTLATKEKIIETLREGNSINETDTIVSLNIQIDQLKKERDEFLEELSILKSDFELKCNEIDHLEVTLRSNERHATLLKDTINQEKSAKDIAECTVKTLNKELQTLQMETAKQISSLRMKLKENKNKKNEKLSEVSSSFGISETGEERFRSLTQALVAKQAALESVTADRNALRLQLEKTENKYRSDLINMKNNQPRIINFNYTDDVKEQFPSLMQETPWDSKFSRRVKKAYSSLDSCSIWIGLFLRRHPMTRIFIIAYMVFLHLWVLIVLCTYSPEIHNR